MDGLLLHCGGVISLLTYIYVFTHKVLSLLLDVAGPSRTLSMVPYVVRQLLIAIGNTANVGKAASSLLLRLLPHHEVGNTGHAIFIVII